MHSSWYLSVAFQSNIGCFSAGSPDFAIVCIGLTLLWRLSAPNCHSATLAASKVAFIIAHHALFTFHSFFSWDCLVWACLYPLYLSLPCVRPLAFYFWHHVMLHWRMITPPVAYMYAISSMCFPSFYLIIYVHLYTFVVCTDDMIMNVFPCLLLIALHVACH